MERPLEAQRPALFGHRHDRADRAAVAGAREDRVEARERALRLVQRGFVVQELARPLEQDAVDQAALARAQVGERVLRLDQLGGLDEDRLSRRRAVVQDAGDACRGRRP